MNGEQQTQSATTETTVSQPQSAEAHGGPSHEELFKTVQSEIDRAWNDFMPGSILARDTKIYNFVHTWKEMLKQRLAKALSA